jgi:SAM-dependent methyltransferase
MMSNTQAPVAKSASPAASASHVCPWWLGPILANPIRRVFESPERLLRPFVVPGMTVLEPGCGMGFFTIPLARLVGPGGKVFALDVQPRMIKGLLRRARRAKVLDRIRASVCTDGDDGLAAMANSADLAVVIHMLHEVPDQAALLRQVHVALRPGGLLLVVEPKGHVTEADLASTIDRARAVGFRDTIRKTGWRGLSAVLEKQAGSADCRIRGESGPLPQNHTGS